MQMWNRAECAINKFMQVRMEGNWRIEPVWLTAAGETIRKSIHVFFIFMFNYEIQ